MNEPNAKASPIKSLVVVGIAAIAGIIGAIGYSLGRASRPEHHEAVAIDGRRWLPLGQIDGTHAKVSLTGSPSFKAYQCETDADRRLVLAENNPGRDGKYFATWRKNLVEQARVAGDWVEDGIHETEYDDGTIIRSTYRMGVLHGPHASFYASGKLHQEWNHVNGKREGQGRAFYESGKPQWIATYVNDKEVSGEAWREDGTKL